MRKSTLLLASALCIVNLGFAQNTENFPVLGSVAVDKAIELPMQRPVQQFNFLEANDGIMKSPTATTALGAPVASAATEVQDESFVANWSAVDGAAGYYLQVGRYLQSTTNEVQVFQLYEDFRLTTPGLKAQGATAVSLVDEGQTMRSWVLYEGETTSFEYQDPETQEIRTLGAVNLNANGMLFSPFMDFSNEAMTTTYNGMTIGTTNIAASLSGLQGDSIFIGMSVVVGQEQQQGIIYQVAFDETQSWAYELYFPENPQYNQCCFFLYAPETNKGKVMIDAFYCYQQMAANTTWDMLFEGRQTQKNSVKVYTLEYDMDTPGVTEEFYYGVLAYNSTEESDFSNVITVADDAAVKGIEVSKDKIYVSDKLHVVLSSPAQVSVYNITGALVGSYQGVEGDNEIALPATGVYVVKAGNTVAKVVK